MRIIQNFDKTELTKVLNDFYKYFKSGYEFEQFLKPFLESIGLSEVVITKKSRDDGVDLTAVKDGLYEINNADSVKYRIQAKRHAPAHYIPPEEIDALRGNLGFNEKGLFITTGKVSDTAKELAISKDQYKPVFVIDGIDLVRICIEKQIGFAYKPVFSAEALDEFTNKSATTRIENLHEEETSTSNTVDKFITTNDVRCNLISVPRFIFDQINNNSTKQILKVIINQEDKYEFTFSPSRRYLYIPNSKSFFEKYGIIQCDGSVNPKKAIWRIDNQIIYIDIN